VKGLYSAALKRSTESTRGAELSVGALSARWRDEISFNLFGVLD